MLSMLWILLYFIRSQLFLDKEQLGYIKITPFFLPFSVLLLAVNYWVIHQLKIYLLYKPTMITAIIFIFTLLVTFIVLLSIFSTMQAVYMRDLRQFLHYDFFTNGTKYKNDYRYFIEYSAYDSWCNFDQLQKQKCSICLEALNNEQPKTLIYCGHLFHTKCIRINESYSNMYSVRMYAVARCPLCKTLYQPEIQTFNFDESKCNKSNWHWLTRDVAVEPMRSILKFIWDRFWWKLVNMWSDYNHKYRKSHNL